MLKKLCWNLILKRVNSSYQKVRMIIEDNGDNPLGSCLTEILGMILSLEDVVESLNILNNLFFQFNLWNYLACCWFAGKAAFYCC